MRKAVIGAGIAALIALLYVIAGYFIAPRFVREALVEEAARRGIELRVEAVRTDPFVLAVVLEGVELSGRDGRTLAKMRSARADLAWSSLWEPRWRLQGLSLHEPHFVVPIGAGTPKFEKASGAAPPSPLVVERVELTEGTVHLLDGSRSSPVELKLEGVGLEATGLSTVAAEPGEYALVARLGQSGRISARGRVSLAAVSAEGRLEAAALDLAPLARFAAPAMAPVAGQLHGASRFSFADGRLVLEEVKLEAADAAYQEIELKQVSLQSARIELPPSKPFGIAVYARAGDGSEASVKGTVQRTPLAADLEIGAKSIALVRAQRWLPQDLGVRIASGAVSAQGRLRFAQPELRYEGALSVSDFRLDERATGNPLLAWRRLETRAARLELAPPAIELGEVVAHAPQGRLRIESDGTVNLVQALGKRGGKSEREPLHVSVRRLRVEQGTLDFADRSLETPFEAKITELSGTITGFSTEPGDPALVALAGRVDKYGSARISGTINLDDPGSLADIRARFRNVDLARLTPYVAKFAGYRVRSGRVSAELRYRVRDGRLVGQNQLVLQDLELGEKVEREGMKSLPLELAVALLADAEGRISIDIPVRGDLRDPQFNFSGLVARAIGNVIGNIVSAPFRALAGLFRAEGDALDRIRFAPGSGELSPPQEENVAQVAKALVERPGLGVTVRGGYDAERDAAALRARAARREIARRAGYETAGPLDFSDPKILHAAENLYLRRVGNRLEMQALRSEQGDAQRYGRALVEALAQKADVGAAAAEALARTRAETVRAALIEHGVEPSRVALENPVAAAAAKEGVPTQLALTAGEAAAAGQTR